mmetsp:Transcript_90600/g.233835  ORF Transcript_90600/g.233835 Transcript_90600/m.233835 type:complete len:458 (-) Transcript_90600:164-1537(-)
MMKGIFPIRELSTYQTGWLIKARVTAKSVMRTFGNGKKVFSADLLDAEGGQIRASFFDAAADHFAKLQQGKCYTFCRGSCRVANRQYNTCPHRYELIFDEKALILEVPDAKDIETNKFSFTDLRTLQTRQLPCTVDLCGILAGFRPPFAFTSKDGKELVKREIIVADDTATSMTVTLWGERAKQDDSVFEKRVPVCLKGVLVKEWNGGRSGSLQETGDLVFDSKLPEAQRVQQWWSQGGANQSLVALSQDGAGGAGGGRAPSGKAATLEEVRQHAEMLGTSVETFSCVCRLALVQTKKQGEAQPLSYMACQEPKEGNGRPCNRRLDESGFCASCNRAGKAAPRLNIRCRFVDFGDSAWLTTFHEAAQSVLELSADEAKCIEQGEGGREALEGILRAKYFGQPLQLGVRAKLDTYNGDTRPNVTCFDARPVQRGVHGRALLRDIHSMLGTTPAAAMAA